MIYQIHPDHGKLMPVSSQEAENNIKNGWKTVTKDEFYGKKEDKSGTVEIFDAMSASAKKVSEEKLEFSHDELVGLYLLKFGKNPHHKMKDSTIRAAIEAD